MKNKTLENSLDKAAPQNIHRVNGATLASPPSAPKQQTSMETLDVNSLTLGHMTRETAQADKELTTIAHLNASMLWDLLSQYTGISASDVASTAATLSELGLDSLAVVELSDEVEAKFGVLVGVVQLLRSSPKSLCIQLCGRVAPVVTGPASSVPPTPPLDQGSVPLEKANNDGVYRDVPRDLQKKIFPVRETRQKLLQMISEASGEPEETISIESTLDELGVDSLAVVELIDDLEGAFQVALEAHVHDVAKLTIAELLKKCECWQPEESTIVATPSPSAMSSQFSSYSSRVFQCNGRPIPDNMSPLASGPKLKPKRETVVYKMVDGLKIHAEIFMPPSLPEKPMPVALTIHGGGHMALSRTSVPSYAITHLLEAGVLPVSVGYRLCPEINVLDGPMADVADAYRWILDGGLQDAVRPWGILVDISHVVEIGWSSGGQLAMSLGWQQRTGLPPPVAVLAYYAPLDWANGTSPPASQRDDCRAANAKATPEQLAEIVERLGPRLSRMVLTTYDDIIQHQEFLSLNWVTPDDPRSQLVGALVGQISSIGSPLLINSLSDAADPLSQPDPVVVASVCPLTQVKEDCYTTPTFLIHGTHDEIVPHSLAVEFVETLREMTDG